MNPHFAAPAAPRQVSPGRGLRFDPKTEQFPGDGEANALLTKKHRAPWGFAY